MAKELYLFSSIYEWTAEAIASQIHDCMGKPATLRALSTGGNVFASYTIYQKIKEHGDITLKIDGALMSAAAFLPLFSKSSSCLNVSRFIFHRADMFVCDAESQDYLNQINADLKSMMVEKIDAGKWKKITGITIDEMFNPETRIDVILTGKQAVEVGLVSELVTLTPQMQKEITALNNNFIKVAAHAETPQLKKPIMEITVAKLKAENPAVYKEVLALGKTIGAKNEKARIEAWMKFVKVDAKSVEAGIASGNVMSQAEMIDFLQKQQNPEALKKINEDNAVDLSIKTPEAELTAKQKELNDFKSEVLANTTTLKVESKKD